MTDFERDATLRDLSKALRERDIPDASLDLMMELLRVSFAIEDSERGPIPVIDETLMERIVAVVAANLKAPPPRGLQSTDSILSTFLSSNPDERDALLVAIAAAASFAVNNHTVFTAKSDPHAMRITLFLISRAIQAAFTLIADTAGLTVRFEARHAPRADA